MPLNPVLRWGHDMGPETISRSELLESLLRIARGQHGLLADNRLAELTEAMAEREEIISRLKSAGAPAGKKEGEIIKKILAYDGNIRLSIEGELEKTRHELEKLSKCNVVHKAYVSAQVKTSVERSIRNG